MAAGRVPLCENSLRWKRLNSRFGGDDYQNLKNGFISKLYGKLHSAAFVSHLFLYVLAFMNGRE